MSTQKTEEKTTRIKYADEMVISLGVDKEGNSTSGKNNPKREGTRCHEQFALYKDGMTVAEYLASGGARASINWDVEKGYIKVDKPKGESKSAENKKKAA